MQTATSEEIRRAYKQRALATHPDKLSLDASEEQRHASEAQFHQVQYAFEVLSNAESRTAYDYHRRPLPLPRPHPFRTPSHEEALSRLDAQRKRLAQARAEWAQKAKQRSEERLKATRSRHIERLAREATSPDWDEHALLGEEYEEGRDARVRENVYTCLVDVVLADLRARTKTTIAQRTSELRPEPTSAPRK